MEPLLGYEGLYCIERDGRIWSCRYKKYMKSSKRKDGYWHIGLRKEGRGDNKLVHRLLAIQFIPNPDNLPCVDHMNKNRTDNRLCNFRWATCKDNSHNRSINKNNTSGKAGVYWREDCKKWVAAWQANGKRHSVRYVKFEDAAARRDKEVALYYNCPAIVIPK